MVLALSKGPEHPNKNFVTKNVLKKRSLFYFIFETPFLFFHGWMAVRKYGPQLRKYRARRA